MQNLHNKANLRDRFDQQEHNLQEDEDVDKIEDSQEQEIDEIQGIIQNLVSSDKA